MGECDGNCDWIDITTFAKPPKIVERLCTGCGKREEVGCGIYVSVLPTAFFDIKVDKVVSNKT